MSFRENGEVMLSNRLSPDARAIVVGERSFRLGRVAEGQQPYLDYHRRYVFREDLRVTKRDDPA